MSSSHPCLWRLRDDPWLEDALGFPVTHLLAAPEGEELDSLLAGHTEGMADCRIPADLPELLGPLVRRGFEVITVEIVLDAPITAVELDLPEGLTIRDGREEDRAPVQAFSVGAFAPARFEMDPRIPDEVCRRLRERWIDACFDGSRPVEIRIAELDGAPVGFHFVRYEDERVARGDLIAVAPEARGRGVGPALLRDALNQLDGKRELLRHGTQLTNRAGIRMYEKIGSRLHAATYLLHRHARAERASRRIR